MRAGDLIVVRPPIASDVDGVNGEAAEGEAKDETKGAVEVDGDDKAAPANGAAGATAGATTGDASASASDTPDVLISPVVRYKVVSVRMADTPVTTTSRRPRSGSFGAGRSRSGSFSARVSSGAALSPGSAPTPVVGSAEHTELAEKIRQVIEDLPGNDNAVVEQPLLDKLATMGIFLSNGTNVPMLPMGVGGSSEQEETKSTGSSGSSSASASSPATATAAQTPSGRAGSASNSSPNSGLGSGSCSGAGSSATKAKSPGVKSSVAKSAARRRLARLEAGCIITLRQAFRGPSDHQLNGARVEPPAATAGIPSLPALEVIAGPKLGLADIVAGNTPSPPPPPPLPLPPRHLTARFSTLTAYCSALPSQAAVSMTTVSNRTCASRFASAMHSHSRSTPPRRTRVRVTWARALWASWRRT